MIRKNTDYIHIYIYMYVEIAINKTRNLCITYRKNNSSRGKGDGRSFAKIRGIKVQNFKKWTDGWKRYQTSLPFQQERNKNSFDDFLGSKFVISVRRDGGESQPPAAIVAYAILSGSYRETGYVKRGGRQGGNRRKETNVTKRIAQTCPRRSVCFHALDPILCI